MGSNLHDEDEHIYAHQNKRVFLLLLLSIALVLDLGVAASMSETYDELDHINYGIHVIRFHPDRLTPKDSSKMPVSALNAIPRGVASILDILHVRPRLVDWLRNIFAARISTVLATLLLLLFVYRYTRELYGPGPARASLVLAVLSPNLIAHGTLATTDLYFALGVIASLYYLRRYLLQPTLRNACLSAFTLALSQLTKSFAIYLYGVAGGFVLFEAFGSARRTGRVTLTRRSVATFAGLALLFFVLMLNVGFCFDRPFTSLNAYHFKSASLAYLQRIPIVSSIPVPIPYPFLQGLDMMKDQEQRGFTFGNVYLLGELRSRRDPTFHGFKSYYAVALFFKEPIPLQVLFWMGLISVWRNRRLNEVALDEGLLIVTVAVLLVWLSFFDRVQIGIRHILPVFAVEIVIAGAAFVRFRFKPLLQKVVLGLLVLWLVISVGTYYPNMIAYMNEWVLDRKLAYKVLADSNLDWGQSRHVVEEFLKNNPDVIDDPENPVAGRILVDANYLVGVIDWRPNRRILEDTRRKNPQVANANCSVDVTRSSDRMVWLRSRYKPVAQIGYTDFLFVVPAADLSTLCQ